MIKRVFLASVFVVCFLSLSNSVSANLHKELLATRAGQDIQALLNSGYSKEEVLVFFRNAMLRAAENGHADLDFPVRAGLEGPSGNFWGIVAVIGILAVLGILIYFSVQKDAAERQELEELSQKALSGDPAAVQAYHAARQKYQAKTRAQNERLRRWNEENRRSEEIRRQVRNELSLHAAMGNTPYRSAYSGL